MPHQPWTSPHVTEYGDSKSATGAALLKLMYDWQVLALGKTIFGNFFLKVNKVSIYLFISWKLLVLGLGIVLFDRGSVWYDTDLRSLISVPVPASNLQCVLFLLVFFSQKMFCFFFPFCNERIGFNSSQFWMNIHKLAKNLRHWASSEPSWQWIWPSQRCQSGMQRVGRRHINWPRWQRPGTGGGAGAQVGTGVSVTVLLAAVREVKWCSETLFQSFLCQTNQKTHKHTGLRAARSYPSGIPVHHCRQDSQRSRHTPRCWWCKHRSRSGSGLVHT